MSPHCCCHFHDVYCHTAYSSEEKSVTQTHYQVSDKSLSSRMAAQFESRPLGPLPGTRPPDGLRHHRSGFTDTEEKGGQNSEGYRIGKRAVVE